MSDPSFQRDQNRSPGRYAKRDSTAGTAFWLSLAAAVIVVLGVVAYSYRGDLASSNGPNTTSGQATRAPGPATPPAAPVAPAQRP
jgi:hypothetical protein